MTQARAVSAGHGKIYFQNLDGLRFIAAFLVILAHCAAFRHALDPRLANPFFSHTGNLGACGVEIFFVLSGFLISYLLLREQETTGRISVKQFYVRRILRIWPLYFAAGIGGTLLAPLLLSRLGLSGGGGPGGNCQLIGLNLLFLCGFAVNFENIFLYNRGIMEILWSVCVEEQFYLLWPWLIRRLRNSWLPILLMVCTVGVSSKLLILALLPPTRLRHELLFYLPLCKFDYFSIGGLAACAWFRRDSFKGGLNWLNTVTAQVVALAAAALLVLGLVRLPGQSGGWADGLIYGTAFALLILVLVAPGCKPLLETRLFRAPGRVSYGLYVFHPIVTQFILRLFYHHLPNQFVVWVLVFPLVVTGVTFAIAWLSYELFEKRFLRLKHRFTPEPGTATAGARPMGAAELATASGFASTEIVR